MNLRIAFCVQSTRIVHVARVHAGSVVAHFVERTFVVYCASNFIAASDGVALVSLDAVAHSAVVHSGALCVVAAVAGFHAVCVDAGPVGGAVRVRVTTHS